MNKKIRFFAFIIFFFIVCNTFAYAKNVAVLDLKNNSGQKSLDFLSYALAETVINTLIRDKDLKVVERSQLKSVVSEYELEQSGLVDNKTIRQIRLLKADYVIIGSYLGKNNISVILRIVDIKSGVVISSGKISGSIRSVFPKTEKLTRSFIANLKGKKMTCLSVETNPPGARVFVDEVEIGTSPIVCYKTFIGKKTITIVKNGYRNYEAEIAIAKTQKFKLHATLTKHEIIDRFNLSMLMHFVYAPDFSINHDFAASFRLGYTLVNFTPFFEYTQTFGGLQYSYTYDVPFDTRKEDRKVVLYSLHAGMLIHPFNATYVSPYFGIVCGYSTLRESHLTDAYYDSSYVLYHIISGGATAGLSFFPYSNLKFFIEARGIYNYGPGKRDVIDSIRFGEVNKKETSLQFPVYTAAVGITFMF